MLMSLVKVVDALFSIVFNFKKNIYIAVQYTFLHP